MNATMTRDTAPRRPQLEHRAAMRLAATEYQRVHDLFVQLTPEHWSAPTNCPGWDVRAMATHMLGMAKMAASIREQSRQSKAAAARGGVFIDALTALQVDEHVQLTPAQIVAEFARFGPKAAAGRRRTPGLIRRRAMPVPQQVNGRDEVWSIGYLTEVILTRDPWLHRLDIAAATGIAPVHTAEYDGVLVDDVVREWASRHGQPCTLRLTGPAGGSWSFGSGGPHLELDTVEFALQVSRRAPAEKVFDTEVPF